jgi:hypothetical protein
MADQTQRLEIATVKAEVGSNILFRFANDPTSSPTIPTDSGSIPNLKQVIAEIQEDGAEKISIATTIYQSAAAGLAATADGGIYLVQSADADEIYTVWKNQGGAAVNTGKTAMSSQAVQAALDASNEAAQAAEDAADIATARTLGLLSPNSVAPVVRDNGLPLQAGDRYFNTTEQAEYIYTSAGWAANESQQAIADIEDATDPTKGAALIGRGFPVVESIAALRTLSKSSPAKNAFVASYYGDGKTGGGPFRLDITDTTTAENWGTVIVADDGGRWKRPASFTFNVAEFGARGDNTSDDIISINRTISAMPATGNRLLYFPNASYRTSAMFSVPNGCNTFCEPGVVFQRWGGATDFNCVQVNGNGKRHVFGIIDSYKDAIVIRGNTNWVEFQTISNCGRGVVISAVSANNLDNRVNGLQIGKCTDAVVFEQNGKRTQQGNEIRVNFVSESLNHCVYDDLGTHTETSNWDSNLVEFMATDPLFKPGATLLLNRSAFAVSNINFSVKSWCGGFNGGDGTMTVISGSFLASQYEFSFAANPTPADMVGAGARASFGSCQCKLLRNSNLGAGTSIPAVPGSTDVFNGGVALVTKKFRISVAVPALATGGQSARFFDHILSQNGFGGKFKIASIERNGNPYIISINEQGNVLLGRVALWFYNPSAATIQAQTISLVIEAGD